MGSVTQVLYVFTDFCFCLVPAIAVKRVLR